MNKESNQEEIKQTRDKFYIDSTFTSLKPMVSGQLSIIFKTDIATTEKMSELMKFYQSKGQLSFSSIPTVKEEKESPFFHTEVQSVIREMGTKGIRQRLDAQIFKKWQETDKKVSSEEFAHDIYANLIEAIKEL